MTLNWKLWHEIMKYYSFLSSSCISPFSLGLPWWFLCPRICCSSLLFPLSGVRCMFRHWIPVSWNLVQSTVDIPNLNFKCFKQRLRLDGVKDAEIILAADVILVIFFFFVDMLVDGFFTERMGDLMEVFLITLFVTDRRYSCWSGNEGTILSTMILSNLAALPASWRLVTL